MRLSPRSSSAGATPRAPSISDQTSPPMTTATAGTSSSIQPPVFRKTSSHLRIYEVESRCLHRPSRTTSRRRQTPVQGLHAGRPSSTSSPPAPEWSTDEARESSRGPYSLMPPPPRRCCQKPNLRNTRTLIYTSDKEPPFFHTSEGPKATRGGVERRPRWWEHESPPFRLSQLCHTKRGLPPATPRTPRTPPTPPMCHTKRVYLQQLQLRKKPGVEGQLHVFPGAIQEVLKKYLLCTSS